MSDPSRGVLIQETMVRQGELRVWEATGLVCPALTKRIIRWLTAQTIAMNQTQSLFAWLDAASGVFTTTLTGLAFETIPFLLLGTLVSSIIHIFVPDSVIRRIFPRNRISSILVALVAGAFVPICECGTVPLARRLREKGLPLSTAAAFLVAAPLANPMTIVSTYVAFKGGPYPIFLFRAGFGLAAAFLIALAVEFLTGRDREGRPDEANSPRFKPRGAGLGTRLAPPLSMPQLPHPQRKHLSLFARLGAVLDHCSHDFLDSARFLIAGISAAALVRALLAGGGSDELAAASSGCDRRRQPIGLCAIALFLGRCLRRAITVHAHVLSGGPCFLDAGPDDRSQEQHSARPFRQIVSTRSFHRHHSLGLRDRGFGRVRAFRRAGMTHEISPSRAARGLLFMSISFFIVWLINAARIAGHLGNPGSIREIITDRVGIDRLRNPRFHRMPPRIVDEPAALRRRRYT